MLHCTARQVGVTPKLQDRWEGPYLITGKLSDVNVRIQKGKQGKPLVVHVDRLKSYKGAYDASWWNHAGATTPGVMCPSAELQASEAEVPDETPVPEQDLQGEAPILTSSSHGRPVRPPNRLGQWQY